MIFNSNISESAAVATNWDAIAPSKYDANLEGALMLVYESECNYNALMRAAGLSELKYYTETGKDLFVHEAGAFGSFLEKAKAFFKSVLDKIKALFKKFFMQINSYVASDKEFVKKYEKDIVRAATNLKDFEFKGYKFTGLGSGKIVSADVSDMTSEGNAILKAALSDLASDPKANYDDDKLNESIENQRSDIAKKIGVNVSGGMTESEFRDEVKEYLYGGTEKEVLDGSDINIREAIDIIRNTKENIKTVEKMDKDATKAFNDVIKNIDAKIKETAKWDDKERTDSNLSKGKTEAVKALNNAIKLLKASSSDITVFAGLTCQALKDRNRQSKAMCIKAVSYAQKKHEGAVEEGTDLFASVVIK